MEGRVEIKGEELSSDPVYKVGNHFFYVPRGNYLLEISNSRLPLPTCLGIFINHK